MSLLPSKGVTMSSNPMEPLNADSLEQSRLERMFDWRDFQPEMLRGAKTFAVELTTYRDHLDSLLADVGKYVVIRGREIVGIYKHFDAAVEAASQLTPEPVLVKKIVEKEPVREVGHVLS
jgi:hypothetical protein